NRALNVAADPNQYGTGFIALGKVTMAGAAKTPTFVRVAQEPKAGQAVVVLEQGISGWQPGDRIILPDTRHLHWNEISNWVLIAPQWEELTVKSIAADGKSVTFTTALRFDHLGARDGAGALSFLPH